MAASAPDYYEIRWRVKNSGAAWGAPQRVHPCDEVVVEELDRTQLYEFEARAVSACGAKSIWVPSDYTVPGENAPLAVDTLTAQALADGVHLGWTSIAIPPAGIEYSVERSADGSTGWAERVRVRSTAYTDPETSGTTYYYRVRAVTFAGTFGPYSPVASSAGVNVSDMAAAAKADADSALTQAQLANQELAEIANDNMLSPAEKPTVIRDYQVLTAEQPGIDAQASAYGITTEKTAYDNAITALTNYLATLTTDTAWNDKTGYTTIVGTTFRSNFNAVYTTRQTLLNAIYAKAQALANTAQATADAAMSSSIVRNPNFAVDANYWSFSTAADFYRENGSNAPNPSISTYLVHQGKAGKTYEYATSTTYIPVRPGQVVVGIMCLRAASPNASARANGCINWYDSSGAFISASESKLFCGVGADFLQGNSRVSAAAPANAAIATVGVIYRNHTSGYINATTASLTPQVSSQDEVPDGQSYVRNIVQSGSAIVVGNANFEAPLGPNGEIPGWKAINGATLALPGGAFSGAKCLQIVGTGTNNFGAQSPNYQCSAGDRIFASVQGFGLSGNPAGLAIVFFGAAGYLGEQDFVGTAYGSWQLLQGTAVAPAGTIGCVVQLYNGNNLGTSYFDEVQVARTVPLATQVAGTLSTQRNLPLVTWGNYGGGWSGLTMSYTATSSSATVNASAGTYVGGGDSIAYSASSVTLSGSPGTYTYYLYYDDPGMTGGSKSLGITTNQITSLNANGRVLLGSIKVTFPASGSGSGSGSGGCPDENAWVLRADPEGGRPDWTVRAKDIEVGHYLRLSDGRAGRVTYSQRKASPRIRVSDDGHALTCSPSAPLELAAGGHGDCILARSSLFAGVRILCPAPVLATQITSVEPMPDGHVQHITCENACFWTGDAPDYLFAHHNRKPDSPP